MLLRDYDDGYPIASDVAIGMPVCVNGCDAGGDEEQEFDWMGESGEGLRVDECCGHTRRYCWAGLRGESGSVISITPAASAGLR